MVEIDWCMKEKDEYNKLSQMYDEYYSPTWPLDNNIQGLINYLRKWEGGLKILELGVGTGNVTGKLYLHGYHDITGIDLSPGMIAYAKHKCPRANLVCEDLRKTDYRGYDWIVAVGSIFNRIGHNDKLKLFKKMYDEMLPGAYLFIGLRNFSYNEEFSPDKEIATEYVNERRGFKLISKFHWLTRDSYQGVTTYIRIKDNLKIDYQFKTYAITGDDLIKTVTESGLKHVGIGLPEETGYYQTVWVFQK